MAPSYHSENFIGKEIVDYAPNHQTENDQALHRDREQSPVVITLMKVQNSLGFTKNVLWSKPINFTLPDDCVEHILELDESLQFFYHNKSGRFRSFIEVEAYIIHSKFPKDRKPKEGSSVVEPSGSASIQNTSVKRETPPKSCNNITEKKRLQAEKFLYEAWRNFSDSSILEDVLISSTNADEEQVMQILNEARNNLLNAFSSKTDQTETLDNDADEDLAQLIADLHQAMQ
ncbi:hypothetical protein Acr_02g0008490 [Actinidia rufa]|uniref:Uncharacterized protein n=1 Tax=Actinidia rufa TaxID=165716 RepID=A0A7J0E9M0_9ERIC|nr:hypothetical protein Acr_02g0008490 [Actinidia rufa]